MFLQRSFSVKFYGLRAGVSRNIVGSRDKREEGEIKKFLLQFSVIMMRVRKMLGK